MFLYFVTSGPFRSGVVPKPPTYAPFRCGPIVLSAPDEKKNRFPITCDPFSVPYRFSKALSDVTVPAPPTAQK